MYSTCLPRRATGFNKNNVFQRSTLSKCCPHLEENTPNGHICISLHGKRSPCGKQHLPNSIKSWQSSLTRQPCVFLNFSCGGTVTFRRTLENLPSGLSVACIFMASCESYGHVSRSPFVIVPYVGPHLLDSGLLQ